MSLSGTYDSNNIFAKILRGDMSCHKVYEDEVSLAFMDAFPQSRGHTLVIPKTSARNFLDLPAEAVGPYLERVHKVAHAVNKALRPDGMRVVQFNGATAGQTVFHLHFHIIPFFHADMLRPHASNIRADDAELAALATQIGAAVG
jgi:histidine triad (HIT) family protein